MLGNESTADLTLSPSLLHMRLVGRGTSLLGLIRLLGRSSTLCSGIIDTPVRERVIYASRDRCDIDDQRVRRG